MASGTDARQSPKRQQLGDRCDPQALAATTAPARPRAGSLTLVTVEVANATRRRAVRRFEGEVVEVVADVLAERGSGTDNKVFAKRQKRAFSRP